MNSTNNFVVQAREHRPTSHSSASTSSTIATGTPLTSSHSLGVSQSTRGTVSPSPTRKPMKRPSSTDSEIADNDNVLVIDESAVKDVVSLKVSAPKMPRIDQYGHNISPASSINGDDDGHDHQEEVMSSAQSSMPNSPGKPCSTQLKSKTLFIKPSLMQHIQANSSGPHLSLVSTGRLCTQTSTMREVYAKYLSSSMHKDHIYTNKLFFLYEIWGLSCDKHYETTNQPLLDLDDCISLDMVSDFFLGVLHTSSPKPLFNFLRKKPEKLVGRFVVAVLIVEYCLKYDSNILYKFYRDMQTDDSSYSSFVTTITKYIVQRAVNRDQNRDIDVTEIPQAILNSVNLAADNIGTEMSKLHKIHLCLTEYIWLDVTNMDGKCFSNSLRYEVRYEVTSSKIWSRIASIVCLNRPYFPKGSLSDMVVLRDLEHRVNTRPFFTAIVDDMEQEVHLHESVVRMYNDRCSPCVRSNVRVSQRDLDLFIQLLYKINIPESWVPNVKMEVLEMAKLIGISDLWDFLFLKNSFVDVWDFDKQKFNILGLAIKARLVKFFKEMGRTIKTFLCGMDIKREAVKDLTNEDILFLCEQVEFDQFELYKLLLHWSFSTCNKTIKNYEEITYKTDVAESFHQVQDVLVLQKMNYSTLCEVHAHQYYNPRASVIKEIYSRKNY